MPPTDSDKTSKRITRRALLCFFTFIVMLILPVFAADKQKDEDTLRRANLLLQDMLNSKDISPTLLSKASCVLLLPGVKKFGFGVGGSGGRGPLLCRTGQNFNGKWSAPAMYSVGGMSAGLQVGGSSSDFVLLLMTEKVVNQILNGKTKMGTDATAAAGPGATAASASDADILTYGRAKGLFAGVSLGGSTVEPDNDANSRLYGKTLTATDIVRGTDVKPSAEGQSLVTMLNSKLPKLHK
ncbi:MAG TPA: lipid-binding SYLF domain-containing protein [Candidatus Acidoferrum sp.]|nr:lipid-binding SYLF domain-containing protein [Candidatus Acidoferrum sp.]